jgi:hypothetical protein
MLLQLSDHDDVFKWILILTGIFTVKSSHLDLLNDHTMYLRSYIEYYGKLMYHLKQDIYVVLL